MLFELIECLVKLLKRRIHLLSSKKRIGGEIRIVHGDNPRLYVRDCSGVHYVRKRDWERVVGPLVQQEYERRLLENDRRWLKAMQTLVALPGDADVLEEMDAAVRGLVRARPLVSDEEVARWLARPGDESIAMYGEHPFRSDRGEWVRSKIELIAANRFHRMGVVYLYEFPIKSRDGKTTYYPDFVILSRRTGREYVYEHFGMMDDPKYARGCVEKLMAYARMGLVLGDNLVATFECAGCPMDLAVLDFYIEKYFL